MAWGEGGGAGVYLCSRSPQKGPGSNSVSNALGWLQPSCRPPFQLLPLLFADWKPLYERPASFIATRRMGDDAFQRAPSLVPMSSPEMPQTKEKPPMEPKDRYGAVGKEVGNWQGGWGRLPAGAADTGWVFLYGLRQILPLVWALVSPSVQWN